MGSRVVIPAETRTQSSRRIFHTIVARLTSHAFVIVSTGLAGVVTGRTYWHSAIIVVVDAWTERGRDSSVGRGTAGYAGTGVGAGEAGVGTGKAELYPIIVIPLRADAFNIL